MAGEVFLGEGSAPSAQHGSADMPGRLQGREGTGRTRSTSGKGGSTTSTANSDSAARADGDSFNKQQKLSRLPTREIDVDTSLNYQRCVPAARQREAIRAGAKGDKCAETERRAAKEEEQHFISQARSPTAARRARTNA